PPALGLIALVVVGLFGGQAGQFFAGLGRPSAGGRSVPKITPGRVMVVTNSCLATVQIFFASIFFIFIAHLP
ncbi:MAG: hypothetical protein SVX38_10520, partial [Chloroflexota bacterium]|nr:hypothetical protein [Chloroflexota bacterium]